MKAPFRLLDLAKYALLAGVLVLGIAAWASWRASAAVGVPRLRDLTPAGGLVVAAREVSFERKDHVEGAPPASFFELDLQTEAGGAVRKLRVDHGIGRARLEPLVNQRVVAHYDRTDANRVYALQSAGNDVIPYAEMVGLLQGRADQARARGAGPGAWLVVGAALCLAGAGGIAWRRRRGPAQAA